MNYFLNLDQDIKRLAKINGLLIKEVQKLVQINHVTFNDIRKKNRCTTDQLFKLCDALNANINEFVHSNSTAEPTLNNELKDSNGKPALLKEIKMLKTMCAEKDKRLALYEKIVKKL